MHERPDFGGLEDSRDERRHGARADLQLDRCQRLRIDRLRDRRGQCQRLLAGELRRGEMAQQRTGEVQVLGVGRDQLDGRRPTGRPDQVHGVFEHRHGVPHAGQALDLAEQRALKPWRSRALSWYCAWPTTAPVSWRTEPFGLALAICEANSSPTPTAIPRSANASWTSTARALRRTA